MSYGIEIFNNNGHVLIDGNHKNFRLDSYGVGQTDNWVTYANEGVVPLVFFRPHVDNVWFGFAMINPDQFRVADQSSSSYSFDYALYRPYATGAAFNTGYGLAIFDAQGAPVFSSNEPCLNVSNVVNAAGLPQNGFLEITVPSQNHGVLLNCFLLASQGLVPKGDGSYYFQSAGFVVRKIGLVYRVAFVVETTYWTYYEQTNLDISLIAADMP